MMTASCLETKREEVVRKFHPGIECLVGLTILFAMEGGALAGEPLPEFFEERVAPLLVEHCLGCHGSGEPKGGLDLTRRSTALKGGKRGEAIVPGRPAQSHLLERVVKGEMPKKDGDRTRRLTAGEVEILREWIRDGAAWPVDRVLDPYERTTSTRAGWDWWSLQPIRRPALPERTAEPDGGSVSHPIDRFVLARLREKGMTPAPPASRRTLIRRLHFDLIGLPPEPEKVDAFAVDEDPRAYETLVDELLDSPAFGERWARYWLDLVRFAETNGYERDATKPHAWRYRDYVIRSFNEDKPFNRFVLEQLAGDELADRSLETVVATGFLRLGTWDDEPNDDLEYRYERLEDQVQATGTTFLGMTLRCARCHNHKFDPIPQVDYYRVASSFWAGFIEARDRKWMGGPTYEELGHEVLGWTDRGREVPPLKRLYKGDPRQPREDVEPGYLSMVRALDRPLEPPPSGAKTTQRRLQLAIWIVHPDNPLTARVFVNRLWQHHFGHGLVRTPNNFGFRGDPPTHPKLLDWLARELIDGGWRVKRLHKSIVTSRTYRMSSVHPSRQEYEQNDFSNAYWWRAERRRLDAEALRDSMLAASGRLDRKMGGESFFPRVDPEALEGLSRKGSAWGTSPESERNRRSIYIFTKRSLLVPLMTVFDFADTTQGCPRRDVTTVAPQALALLNNRFVHDCSESFARRLLEDGKGRPDDRIRSAWRIAFAREPSAEEVEASRRHIRAQRKHFESRLGKPDGGKVPPDPRFLAWASLCHVLLNANEFIYVD